MEILIWVKAFILWACVKENREIGIRYTKKGLDLARIVAKFTPTTKDDKVVAYLAEKFKAAVYLHNSIDETSGESIGRVAEQITAISSGSLKDVSIGLSDEGVSVSVGSLKTKYNPKNGSVKFSLSK